MTDSTTDTQSADGGFEVGSSVDDLFGEIESDGDSGVDQRVETDDGDGSDAVEDQTAADVFDQLRTDAGDENGADDILADESPDDIIASADEPAPSPTRRSMRTCWPTTTSSRISCSPAGRRRPTGSSSGSTPQTTRGRTASRRATKADSRRTQTRHLTGNQPTQPTTRPTIRLLT